MFIGRISSGFAASLHITVKMIPILEPYKNLVDRFNEGERGKEKVLIY